MQPRPTDACPSQTARAAVVAFAAASSLLWLAAGVGRKPIPRPSAPQPHVSDRRPLALGCDSPRDPPPWMADGGTPFFRYNSTPKFWLRSTRGHTFDAVARAGEPAGRATSDRIRQALGKQAALNRAVESVGCQGRRAPLRLVIADFFVNRDGSDSGPSPGGMAAIDNHRRYAATHGYSYRHISNASQGVGGYLGKLEAAKALLQEFEWVLFLDLDALVVDFSRRVEHVLHIAQARGGPKVIDILFSGDTNLVNSGVLLYRRSKWTMQLLDNMLSMGINTAGSKMKIGMTKVDAPSMVGDNAALAILLAGCSATDSPTEWKACYERVDADRHPLGGQCPTHTGEATNCTTNDIVNGVPQVLLAMGLPMSVRSHIALVPQSWWQSCLLLHSWIVHYPGGRALDDPALIALQGHISGNKRSKSNIVSSVSKLLFKPT